MPQLMHSLIVQNYSCSRAQSDLRKDHVIRGSLHSIQSRVLTASPQTLEPPDD